MGFLRPGREWVGQRPTPGLGTKPLPAWGSGQPRPPHPWARALRPAPPSPRQPAGATASSEMRRVCLGLGRLSASCCLACAPRPAAPPTPRPRPASPSPLPGQRPSSGERPTRQPRLAPAGGGTSGFLARQTT